ncbi:hypothetical protein GCK72_020276 [Caenorhabditis remanei]|uniref:Cysteine-rich transmembrane domain-containing protein n=1 Tax=Caenorhabditis remanei TaxID=31234 RepID=A0A6A5GH04_CAERE|nr:hypothetical protein GCK72_020276 [Caenorhabditis remanei]KAF1753719.1 hypothetical protein GCK72_020276 [Caenorhabditis remanei]
MATPSNGYPPNVFTVQPQAQPYGQPGQPIYVVQQQPQPTRNNDGCCESFIACCACSEKMLADLKEAGMSEANINKLNKIYEDYLTKRAEIKAKTRKGYVSQEYQRYILLRDGFLRSMPAKEKRIFENYIYKYENHSGY